MNDILQIQSLLTSDQGRLIGAGALYLAVLLSKQVPWLRDRLQTPWQKRAYAFLLAFLPVLAFALTQSPSLGKAVWTAIFTFFGATTAHHFTDKGDPAPSSPVAVGSPDPGLNSSSKQPLQ